ncbi:phenylalanyl-tRNA synthetase beta subunit [Pseudopedobacter saltans DSM 12145]|uniref:Phenylalanine--tRNA ligase beta subunit n=1 Tax=Pseudopedobacter saltans (strain ATCC 51119 / DSM 12145 / JCM 21818 / CCUG 39354 / LMG 10337 / NBRC 100064 / NCIMB 13643) TaxID=762903 RepID=F0S738_PSESL|nr:phenylalanine--tRNA ligase subunit beta [Pseudopedobacter saltans]ADY54311.1 phenylalanyl-tRNA synthetase beta subunit [Pseudopedobacter saltans DSM 12145]
MKISYNWLKQFLDINSTPEEISKILTAIGLEVESLEKVQAVPGGLEGLVIGYVKEAIQHPNADRLRVTKVDVGLGEDLQVVCGAPNVSAGQKVVVATVGTTVYPNTGEPFKINKSKIRGEVSEGMICAEDEIGLGESHDGIMVLADDAKIGMPAKEFFNLNDDYLFEIGLTPNRADAASHLGVARDIAAFLEIPVKKSDVEAFKIESTVSPIVVEVADENLAQRYSGVSISGISVKESPQWLKEKLAVIGVRSINNVVDVTNYVLHDLGQPLHAFDAKEIIGNKVVVKTAEEGRSFVTLDGVERKLTASDLIIYNAEEPMCIAGVFGGLNSGVKESTTDIFLESAYFNAVSVRKTSKRFGLKTDSSFRFERGTDPEITVYALKRAALLIQEVAGGTISSEIFDHYPKPVTDFKVNLSINHVNRLIGQEIGEEKIKSIIRSLGIRILSENDGELSLSVPSYKVDVTRDVDVIEEVLRIYGYDNIAIPNKVNASLNYTSKPDRESVQQTISDLLSANGFYEILSNSLTKSAYSKDLDHAVKILNPLSSDLDVMRQSMIFSGLEAVAYNSNRKNSDLKFYEFGKIYAVYEDKYVETPELAVFITGKANQATWNSSAAHTDFYSIKSVVDNILARLNIVNLNSDELNDEDFAYGVKYNKGQKTLVKFGAVSGSALKQADVDKPVFAAVFDWNLVLTVIRSNKITYKEVSKFPAVRRDLSMLIDTNVTFEQLKRIAVKTEKNLLKAVDVFDVYQGDKLPAGKKSYALSFVLQDEEKTLADKQIDAVMQKIILNLEKESGAEIRK